MINLAFSICCQLRREIREIQIREMTNECANLTMNAFVSGVGFFKSLGTRWALRMSAETNWPKKAKAAATNQNTLNCMFMEWNFWIAANSSWICLHRLFISTGIAWPFYRRLMDRNYINFIQIGMFLEKKIQHELDDRKTFCAIVSVIAFQIVLIVTQLK